MSAESHDTAGTEPGLVRVIYDCDQIRLKRRLSWALAPLRFRSVWAHLTQWSGQRKGLAKLRRDGAGRGLEVVGRAVGRSASAPLSFQKWGEVDRKSVV